MGELHDASATMYGDTILYKIRLCITAVVGTNRPSNQILKYL